MKLLVQHGIGRCEWQCSHIHQERMLLDRLGKNRSKATGVLNQFVKTANALADVGRTVEVNMVDLSIAI